MKNNTTPTITIHIEAPDGFVEKADELFIDLTNEKTGSYIHCVAESSGRNNVVTTLTKEQVSELGIGKIKAEATVKFEKDEGLYIVKTTTFILVTKDSVEQNGNN